jgi:hypothetical protein
LAFEKFVLWKRVNITEEGKLDESCETLSKVSLPKMNHIFTGKQQLVQYLK